MKSFKILLTLCLFFILSTYLAAQTNNLYFNQVIKFNFTGAATNFTVPAGKVWKVEQAVADFTLLCGGNFMQYSIQINDAVIVYQHKMFSTGQPGGYAPSSFSMFPIWYPAGTYSVVAKGFDCSNTFVYPSGYLSVLEFNVAP